MKKTIAAAAAAIMCLSMSVSVSADVIIEPMDSFYMEHRNEIEYSGNGKDGRQYILTGDTAVYDEPGGKKTGSFSSGKSPYILYIYTGSKGKQWGAGYEASGGDKLFWICIDGLEAVYDRYSFEEEHKDEITENTNDEFASLKPEGGIYLWSFPGSMESVSLAKPPENFGSYISKVYTDDMGQKWGYIGYIYGSIGWIFISDPSDPAPYKEDVSSGAVVTDSIFEESSSGSGYAAAAVLALAAAGGSAGLVTVLKKKKS